MKPFSDGRVAALLLVAAMPVLATARQPQRPPAVSKADPAAGQREAAVDIWTDHLKLRTYPSDPAVAPGQRTSLVLEIEPGERMHVYAPGATGYRVITLTIASQPFVRLLELQYPASEIYVFEPLNERVPTYQKPFKLVQELILDAGPKAQAALRGKAQLTLTGSLDYQACDDRICFNPVSIPLSWTLALQAARRPGGTATPE